MQVLKHGNTFKHMKCQHCGCEFDYVAVDTESASYTRSDKPHRVCYIYCPECGRYIELNREFLKRDGD